MSNDNILTKSEENTGKKYLDSNIVCLNNNNAVNIKEEHISNLKEVAYNKINEEKI